MNPKDFASKFWIEVVGIALSVSAAIITARTGSPADQSAKIVGCLFSAGIFGAILRSRFEVLGALNEHKASLRLTLKAVELYTEVTELTATIQLPNLRERAVIERDQFLGRVQELAKGRIVLQPSESMFHQAAMVRAAKKEIFAVHTVKDERDLSKWLKRDGEFNILKQAYKHAKERLEPKAMVRVFVVASELTENTKCMESLYRVKELSEHLGFRSSIILRESGVLDKQTYVSLLLVDRSGLVTVQIGPGEDREFKIVSYQGDGLAKALSQDSFAAWESLRHEDDMSHECFAGVTPTPS